MAGFVRVRLENGAEASIPESSVPDGVKPLRGPALLPDGQVAPTKLRVPKGAASATTDSEVAPASDDAPKEG